MTSKHITFLHIFKCIIIRHFLKIESHLCYLFLLRINIIMLILSLQFFLSLHLLNRLVPMKDFFWFFSFLVLPFDTLVFAFIMGSNLKNRINKNVNIRLCIAHLKLKILINLVEFLRRDATNQIWILLGPVFKDDLKVRTDLNGFLQKILAIFIE